MAGSTLRSVSVSTQVVITQSHWAKEFYHKMLQGFIIEANWSPSTSNPNSFTYPSPFFPYKDPLYFPFTARASKKGLDSGIQRIFRATMKGLLQGWYLKKKKVSISHGSIQKLASAHWLRNCLKLLHSCLHRVLWNSQCDPAEHKPWMPAHACIN